VVTSWVIIIGHDNPHRLPIMLPLVQSLSAFTCLSSELSSSANRYVCVLSEVLKEKRSQNDNEITVYATKYNILSPDY
jgi:hypothetical protein